MLVESRAVWQQIKRTVSRHTDQSNSFLCVLFIEPLRFLQQISLAAEKSREQEKKNLMKELFSNVIRTSHVHFRVYLSSNRDVFWSYVPVMCSYLRIVAFSQQIGLAAEKSREMEKKNLMKELFSKLTVSRQNAPFRVKTHRFTSSRCTVTRRMCQARPFLCVLTFEPLRFSVNQARSGKVTRAGEEEFYKGAVSERQTYQSRPSLCVFIFKALRFCHTNQCIHLRTVAFFCHTYQSRPFLSVFIFEPLRFSANQARGGKVTRAGEEEFDEGAVFKTHRVTSKRAVSCQNAPFHVIKMHRYTSYVPSTSIFVCTYLRTIAFFSKSGSRRRSHASWRRRI